MRIGRHMPTHSKMVRAAEIAQQIGCQAIQIFASNPTAWRTPTIDPADCLAFAQAVEICLLSPVVLHAPYLINLGSPDDVIWQKSINLLTWTLQKGAHLGASYVVFHTGSHRGTGVEAGVERVALGVERVMQETPETVMLLLENDVGAGHTLGHSFEQLAAILALRSEYQERLGVCLDTAHLWGAGYDISTAASTQQVLQHFDETIGCARLKVLHLNDTEKALGSHRDVHARLGEGVINAEGLRTLLTDLRLAHVAVLMETPIETDEEGKEDWDKDALQIARAKALASYASL
jgi:deoxyribonuclease-4